MARRLSESDVFNTFRSSYRLKIIWKDILPAKLAAWMNNYELANNCSKDMVFPTLLSLTACLCGPNTTVSSNGNAFVSPLNMYNFLISAPGGGKSNTYTRVVEPVLDNIAEKHGIRVGLECYTTAGIHKHQQSSNGYGIITGDEGERFLASISNKQKNGESDKALLNKMWNSKGDSSTLANGQRGFSKTSMSTCIFVQPQVLIQELLGLQCDDGLMDRFLFYSVKPIFHRTENIKYGIEMMKGSPMQNFTNIFEKMYVDHMQGHQQYLLDDAAQIAYDEYVDSYARYMEERYNSDSDKENGQQQDILLTQPQVNITSSKDTSHVIRLAANLHILCHYWNSALRETENQTDEDQKPPLEIGRESIDMAKAVYNTLSQQKSVYIQAITTLNENSVRLKKVKTFRERITKAVCKFPGPAVPLRDLQKHIKGALVDNLKLELQNLERNGLGKLQENAGRANRSIFFKVPGTCIDESIVNQKQMLRVADMSVTSYVDIFNNTTNVSQDMLSICKQFHPQAEAIGYLFTNTTLHMRN